MPHLRRWASDGVRFTNVTDQTSEGRTSDAEFASLVSLLPLDHGAVAFRFPGNHYVGLPRVLAEHGYATLSAVPFESGFWNRRVMHASYGFQRSLFEPDFELTEQIGWGLNDRDFLQQMVPRLTRLSRPFAAWLITLSLHHPFDDFPERHKVLEAGSARAYVVRQLPPHDALLRPGARGLPERAGARRPARRHAARRLWRSRCGISAQRRAGQHHRHRHRRRRLGAERSGAAAGEGPRAGKRTSDRRRGRSRRARPTSPRRCSRCWASTPRSCPTPAGTCSGIPAICRCRVLTATGSTARICS